MKLLKILTASMLILVTTLGSTFAVSADENKDTSNTTETRSETKGSWIITNGKWWYDKGNGEYAKEEYIDGYWLDSDGWYAPEWYGKWYQNKSGWWFQSGSWYPQSSWLKIDNNWYYFENSGYMATSKWVKSGRNWYYMKEDGTMATDTTIDGYKIDKDGKWENPNPVDKLIANSKTAQKTDQIVLVLDHELSVWNKQADGSWKSGEAMYCGYGKNGFSYPENRTMGDKTTPKGSFELLYAFGKVANPGTAMNYYPITPYSYLSSEKATYNTWVESTTPVTGEHLTDYYQYKYAVNIGFNVNPTVYGKGAGIFLHVKSNTSWNTGGCISLSEENIIKVLKELKNGAYMIIVEDESEITSRDL